MLTVKLNKRSKGRTPLRSLVYRCLMRVRPARSWCFRIEMPSGGGVFRFAYPLNTAMGQLLFKGGYEPDELLYFCSQVRAGQTVLDIGANGGLYSLAASLLVGKQGQVHCFEPGERERTILNENIALNQSANISVHPLAISNTTGTAKFAISRDGAMNSLASTDHPLQDIVEWEEVQTCRLDEFVQNQKLDRIDFIKIDVEGAEKLVVEGGLACLSEMQLPTILFEAVEVNARGFGYQVKELIEMVQSVGYNLFYFDAEGALQPLGEWKTEFGDQIYNFVARRPEQGEAH